ncbi:uncharacterized protein LY89DRAFT_721299 [Mollisia scopiformis]|uniref:Aminoglycoside phosphotransferase domain-containing protein n=1 Tax=Mollisia scopiformis TaxID=149040 RepID=A0A194WZ68_MOLSC|nr:uncharacterized protein LY89DRAFT_721299 [Mollisia scopiformis]KUJ13248.1 hypothetical protein LY89DRAFT_721299 [Mollisia scopiformis]
MSESSESTVTSETSTLIYGQECFDTYQLKVIQLCNSLNLGAPSSITRMQGGCFNRVIGLSFSSKSVPSEYILHIPREPLEARERQSIKDQVAILLHLTAYLPVANVLAYDYTTENAILSQYVIQSRIPGSCVEAIYEGLDIEEKIEIAEQVAELIVKIESIELSAFGRLVQESPMPDSAHDLSQILNRNIGVQGYRQDLTKDMPTTSLKTLPELLRAMFKSHGVGDAGDEELVGYWDRLHLMLSEMESNGLLSNETITPRLTHWDLSSQNILVDKTDGVWKVTGVVDWDDAISVPEIIGRKPPVWLWAPEVRVEDVDVTDVGELNDGQQTIKERVEEVFCRQLPRWRDDAHLRGKWLRRIWAFARHEFY